MSGTGSKIAEPIQMMITHTLPPVGLFGKLPSHPDFIRLNAGSPLARSLDRWMQEGLSQMRLQAGENWETIFDQAPPLFFAYRDKNPDEALVGVCRPGRDQSGRRYPFSIFAHVSLGRGGTRFHLLPRACARFLKAARRLATTDCAHGIDNQRAAMIMNLSSSLPQNLVESQSRFDHYLGDITMGSFWRGFYPDFEDDRKYLIMKNLFSALAPRRGHDPMRLGFSLRLPTAVDSDAAATQIAIWFLICRGAVGNKTLEQSVLFWYADSPQPFRGCQLFFRAPSSMGLTSILDPSRANDSVWDIESMGADRIDEARSALGGELADVLDSPDYSLKRFITEIAA